MSAHRRSRVLLIALGVLAMGSLAATSSGQSLGRDALSARLKPATRTAIAALADSLTASGLPAGAIYDKAAEGVLKDADDARILSVVRALAQRLREARHLLGASARADDLIGASSALYAGVPASLIRRTASMRGDRPTGPSLALTLTVLGTLVSQHVPADVAASSLESLLSRGAREQDLQEFQRAVESDILGGGAPADATTHRTQSVLRTIESRRPQEERSAVPPDSDY